MHGIAADVQDRSRSPLVVHLNWIKTPQEKIRIAKNFKLLPAPNSSASTANSDFSDLIAPGWTSMHTARSAANALRKPLPVWAAVAFVAISSTILVSLSFLRQRRKGIERSSLFSFE
jgi:hypothetical protein